MASDTESDIFNILHSGPIKGNMERKCLLGFLVGGVVVSVLLSVISLSVVLTHYKVEVHVDSGGMCGGESQSTAAAQTAEVKAPLLPARKTANGSIILGAATQYKITVRVGHLRDSQTDHSIYATLIGQYASCGRFLLESPIDNFQLGAVDEFLVICEDPIGELKLVEMHNEGTDGLYISSVTVVNLANKREYDLPCSCWIDDEAGGGILTRNLTVERHCVKMDL